MKLWYRYLLFKLAKTFHFILFCIFIGYILVDLSVNGVRFFSEGSTTFIDTILYYLRQFAMHLELFLPLSFLLASMKVLVDFNSHRELVALQMAGLSKKKLLSPFFLFAGFLTLVCYVNTQWFAPEAQEAVYLFRDAHPKAGKKKIKKQKLFSLSLDDDSELVYQRFDASKKELFDVFWVRSADDIWHMKYLKTLSKPPIGRFVDHLTRNFEKQFEKSESFETRAFPKLLWKEDATLQRFVPFENRSLTQLLQQASADTAERASVFSHLHYKIALPLLHFFILFSIGPISMRFARHRPTFLIAACSLFGFISLMIILDGMLILGENQVFPGYFAIWLPMAITFACVLRPFIKL
ncbi:MAG TPA: LptF/LptG family permease [Chlamydiales bacterium]|nr:LptF/LptG family permease [Chlamydiales bacterium]